MIIVGTAVGVRAIVVAAALAGRSANYAGPSRLMQLAEEEAIRRGCTRSYLTTSEGEAPGFYPLLGYTVFGELEDFPPPYKRYFFQKKLTK